MAYGRIFLFLFAFPAMAAKPSVEPKPVRYCDTYFGQLERRIQERSYQDFEAAIQKRRETEKPVYDKLARILKRFGQFTGLNDKHNARFVRKFARPSNRGKATEAKLFFDMENAVLKELNDVVVQDKDVVTALTNLQKDLLWQIADEPELKKHILASYSDFKSVRIAFDVDDPVLRRRLTGRVEEISRRYKEYLQDVVAAKEWDLKGRGLSRDPQNWFHGGLGASADEANLAAKFSRSNLVEGKAKVRAFGEAVGSLEQAAKNSDRYQGWIERRFDGVDGFLVPVGNGKKILSAEAVEAFLKVKPALPGAEAFFQAIQEAAALRFGLKIDLREARALSEYMTLVNRFSPGLLQEERVVIDLARARRSVISADFKGQNARNQEETMRAFAQTQGQPLIERIRAVRAGEENATASLDEKKARFRAVIEGMFPGVKTDFSGDDGIAYLDAALTPAQREDFVKRYRRAGGSSEDLRLTFEEFRYADTGESLPDEIRSALVVQAEGLEKDLRTELIRHLPRKELNDLQIAVSLGISADGQRAAVLDLSSAASLPAGLRQKVEAIARKKGMPVREVRLLP